MVNTLRALYDMLFNLLYSLILQARIIYGTSDSLPIPQLH